MKRAIWIVLDSVGMGELPDAEQFGDVGANTILSASKAVDGFDLPNMRNLGYGNIVGMRGILPVEKPMSCPMERIPRLDIGRWLVSIHQRRFRRILMVFPRKLWTNFF